MTTPVDEPELEPDDNDEQPLDMRGVRKLRNENKRLRHLLRETEENRASDLARIAGFEKREVEREASSLLVDPEDIWRTDEATQQAFVDQQFGEVVGDRVREAAEAIITSKPHLARPPTARPPTDRPVEGLRSGAMPQEKPKPIGWASAIRGQ
jgi:hypothetical protein